MLHTLKQQSQQIAPDTYRLARLTNPMFMGNPTPTNCSLDNTSNGRSDALGKRGNNLRHPRPQSEVDKYASQYKNIMACHQQLPSSLAPSLTRMASLGQPPESLRCESLGLQQVFNDAIAMRYLGPHDTTLKTVESLGPTPLRPGVSATLAQMKMADLYKQSVNNADGSSIGHHPISAIANAVGDRSRRVFCVPPNVAMSKNSAGAVPVSTFKTGASLNDHVKMTSAPRQGISCASLDDLCRAAGLYLSPEQKSLLPEKVNDILVDGNSSAEYRGAAKTPLCKPAASVDASGRSNKMKMAEGLMDTVGQQQKDVMPNQAFEKGNEWASTEWENVKNASSNATSSLKLGKNDQSLVDDSDEEGANDDAKQPVVPKKIKRRASLQVTSSPHGKKWSVKRQKATSSFPSQNSKGLTNTKQATVKHISQRSIRPRR